MIFLQSQIKISNKIIHKNVFFFYFGPSGGLIIMHIILYGSVFESLQIRTTNTYLEDDMF